MDEVLKLVGAIVVLAAGIGAILYVLLRKSPVSRIEEEEEEDAPEAEEACEASEDAETEEDQKDLQA